MLTGSSDLHSQTEPLTFCSTSASLQSCSSHPVTQPSSSGHQLKHHSYLFLLSQTFPIPPFKHLENPDGFVLSMHPTTPNRLHSWQLASSPHSPPTSFLFFGHLLDMQDLSSQTRDWSHTPHSGSSVSTPGPGDSPCPHHQLSVVASWLSTQIDSSS